MRWIFCYSFIFSFISLAQISGEKIDPLVENQKKIWGNNRAAAIGEVETLYLKKLEETKTKLVKLGKLAEARAYENAKTSQETSDNDPPQLVKMREVRRKLIDDATKEVDQKYWETLKTIKEEILAKGNLEGAESVEAEMNRVVEAYRSKTEANSPEKTNPNQPKIEDMEDEEKGGEKTIALVSKKSSEFKKYFLGNFTYSGQTEVKTFNGGSDISYLGVQNTADEKKGEFRNNGTIMFKFPRPIHLKKARLETTFKSWDSNDPNFKGTETGRGRIGLSTGSSEVSTNGSRSGAWGENTTIKWEIPERSIYGEFLYLSVRFTTEHIPKDAEHSATQFAWEDESNKDPLPFLKLTFYND